MPVTDYSKTIIYKIVCNDLSVKDCYVGNTTNMTKRKYSHKSICHNDKSKHHNRKIYKIIRENGGWENWSMILVEEFPCKDNHEACKRERQLYEQLGAKMNMLRPYITHEEYNQIQKKHYEKHKQKYKQYHEDHKAEIKEKRKKYLEEKKEELNEKIECEFCKKILSKCSMYRHYKICKSKE